MYPCKHSELPPLHDLYLTHFFYRSSIQKEWSYWKTNYLNSIAHSPGARAGTCKNTRPDRQKDTLKNEKWKAVWKSNKYRGFSVFVHKTISLLVIPQSEMSRNGYLRVVHSCQQKSQFQPSHVLLEMPNSSTWLAHIYSWMSTATGKSCDLWNHNTGALILSPENISFAHCSETFSLGRSISQGW